MPSRRLGAKVTDNKELRMRYTQEPQVIRFLRSSGLDLTDEQVKQVLQFQRRADEARNLSDRFRPAYPIKRDVTALKTRWEAGDPNVSRCDYGEGHVTYELQSTKEQLTQIEAGYLASRPPWPAIHQAGRRKLESSRA